MNIDLYTTCPSVYQDVDPQAYLATVRDVCRWSDAAGCRGMLVYTENNLLDAWLVSQVVIQNSAQLSPLVAVQPVYTHPYTAAKMVSTLSYLYGRRVNLNMVAGGFKNDLAALGDSTPHDRRYDRLVEYTTIIKQLLRGGSPVTFHGEFYNMEKCSLKPALPKELFPIITISGSSPAGMAAARQLDAIAIRYPEPPERCAAEAGKLERSGIRVGIIARESEDEAWDIAYQRFPPDRGGQIIHKLAMSTSDSYWHNQLSTLGKLEHQPARRTYWLAPFENYESFAPFLVGSYVQVAEQLSRYISAGYSTFITEVPAAESDLQHICRAFECARRSMTGDPANTLVLA
ncbi:MAG TPA: LLM class flavin-dependent oxidoreductase [Bryobacteraceae bacterium]|nr:LLM class flavin-dependent oxidoreductase [Bryobacteraceae bacterium]